jgi:hypothetical protein
MNWQGLVFLQEISSQPSCKSFYFFLTPIIWVPDRNGNSNNFFVLNVPYFQELGTSTIFDGYTGIQSTNEMDACCPNHSY